MRSNYCLSISVCTKCNGTGCLSGLQCLWCCSYLAYWHHLPSNYHTCLSRHF